MLKQLVMWIANRLYPVKIANTEEEKMAVFRFRYYRYVEQMNKRMETDADHTKKIVFDEYDFDKNTVIFYINESNEIIATGTYRIWSPGTLPKDVYDKYKLELFPFINSLTVCEFAYVMVDTNKQNKLLFLSLMNTFFSHITKNKIVIDMIVAYSMPGLFNYYQKFGCRLYSDQYVINNDGLRVRWLFIPYDIVYLKKVSYPFIFLAKRYARAIVGQYEKSCALINSVLKKNSQQLQSIITSPDEIYQLIKTSGLTSDSCKLLEVLSFKELAGICGLIMHIPAHVYIIKEGGEDREIYLILNGAADIEIDKTNINSLTKGAIFGEMAFFLETGRRSADVYIPAPTTLLVIRRNDVKRFMKNNPKLATKFLFIVSQIICERLASVIEVYSNLKRK